MPTIRLLFTHAVAIDGAAFSRFSIVIILLQATSRRRFDARLTLMRYDQKSGRAES